MKIDRLISIIMMLLNSDKVSAAKLAEMFEVTPRTIYRDIETISCAGIPIVTYPGANGGIGIMPDYKVDKKFFTTSEISTLLMGLGSVSTTMSEKEVTGALEKVKGLLPKEQFKDIELQSNQISIDLTTWMGNRNFQSNLETIKRGLNENRLLSFDYYGVHGKKSSRQIEPYQLVLKERHWYLQGYCVLREDFRVFKLSRMSALELLETTFERRQFRAKSLDGKGWIDQRLITIKLLVHWSLRERMVELCGEENIEPHGENRFMVHFPFTEDERGYGILLGFGDKCECLEPEHIRKELILRIKKLAKVYSL